MVIPAPSAATAQSRVDTLYVQQRISAFQPKDEGTAFLWSFFFPGAGQMYAGEAGKGAALFVASNVGFVATVVGLVASPGVHQCTQLMPSTDPFGNSYTVTRITSCSDSRAPENALAIGGAVLWIGSWIYSMADAGNAVRRWNERHGLTTASVAPILQQTPRGRTLGLSFALRR